MLDFLKYEAVSMLDFSDDERETLIKRAEACIEGFGKLETIEVGGVEPLVSVLSMHTVLREDVSEKLLSRDEVMANAPEQYDGYFQVPGTLE